MKIYLPISLSYPACSHWFKGGGGAGNRGRRPNYSTILVRENEKYENYYNGLHIVPDDEKDDFWAALRRNLPNSFRFTGSKSHALAVQERLKDFYIPKITSITHEGNPVDPPKPVPWYPDQLAWSMTTPKSVIRRFAPFASFQKFLVAETDVGNISRQEVVSMIPPLVLDVRPGMTVLDMCAAPGSKSAQLMELVHAGEEERMAEIAKRLESVAEAQRKEGTADIPKLLNGQMGSDGLEDDGRSTGLLIANDNDYKRAHLLIHQMKRLNSPNLIVTNHDATMYPSLKLPSLPPPEGKPVRNRYLKFDRILADVPCSGDGTTRKNVNVWKDWNPANALGLHLTQCRILTRALQMLKVGGRVVYSTCSMNPVENEAVIASVIDRCGGPSKVHIMDCSNELPALKRSPGLSSWTIMDKQGRTWSSWKDVEEAVSQGDDTLNRIVEGMFPPLKEEGIDLSRCMRVYPHQQDTGAFFITVLEKMSDIKARPEGTKKSTASSTTESTMENTADQDGTPAPSEAGAVSDKLAPNESFTASATVLPSAPKRAFDESSEDPANKRQKVEDSHPEPPSAPSPAKAPEEKTDQSAQEVPPTPGDAGPSESVQHKPTESIAPSLPAKRRPGQPMEEPFKYLHPKSEEFDQIFSFYDISPQFPRDRFMVRNSQGRPAKTIYYTSTLARDILTANEGAGIKFVHSGVKMFVKQYVQHQDVCPWRIQTDGLAILESWVGPRRVVKIYQKETLRKLLIEMFPKVNDNGWRQLGEIGEWARDVDMGCCVLRIEPTENEDGFRERMVLPLWRSMFSLNLMLPKEERRAMLLRLYDDDTPLVNMTQKRKEAAAATLDQTSDAVDAPTDAPVEDVADVRSPADDTETPRPVEEDKAGDVTMAV
ncbi:methyltransferase [Blastomyces dermatitidis ER-3]|uniref:Methyltransferase n=1 Tax=Ajellomyces dermatitidis (strain ER-3 / ATCC MYA-2586) TaxID=559297 RepID=A0ABP2EPJ8_AJEDR|nr:methyltransferase [Blastomyces dermatitidis ER-3]EEQ84172.2 methyltransferase [Blastomyces dermatitidis ER-3]